MYRHKRPVIPTSSPLLSVRIRKIDEVSHPLMGQRKGGTSVLQMVHIRRKRGESKMRARETARIRKRKGKGKGVKNRRSILRQIVAARLVCEQLDVSKAAIILQKAGSARA